MSINELELKDSYKYRVVVSDSSDSKEPLSLLEGRVFYTKVNTRSSIGQHQKNSNTLPTDLVL